MTSIGSFISSIGKAASAVWKTLPTLEEVKSIFKHDYIEEVYQEKANSTPLATNLPYEHLTLSEEDQKNISNMILGLAQNNIFHIAASRHEVKKAGISLWGISVLKIFEHIVLNPDLKAKTQLIFNYSQYKDSWLPSSSLLIVVKDQLFDGFSRFLEEHRSEIHGQNQIADFAKAINKPDKASELNFLLQNAAEKVAWDKFFKIVLDLE